MDMLSLGYASFLIRLWREPATESNSEADIVLTAQVECIPNGEKRYFTSLEDLCAYLYERGSELPARGGGKETYDEGR